MIRLTKAQPERETADVTDAGKPVCVRLSPAGIQFRRKGCRTTVTLSMATAYRLACQAEADSKRNAAAAANGKRPRRPSIKRGGLA